MILVADTNIIFSMLLKENSKEWNIACRDDIDIFIPKFLVIEILKHKERIIGLSGLSENEILENFYLILKYCTFFDEADIPKEILEKATDLVNDIDPKDMIFVASAITLNAKLWSGDKKLIKGLKDKGVEFIVQTREIY